MAQKRPKTTSRPQVDFLAKYNELTEKRGERARVAEEGGPARAYDPQTEVRHCTATT